MIINQNSHVWPLFALISYENIFETLRRYSMILKWVHHTIPVKSGIVKMNDFNSKVTYNEK